MSRTASNICINHLLMFFKHTAIMQENMILLYANTSIYADRCFLWFVNYATLR